MVRLLHRIESVEPLGGHVLRLRFDDGFEGDVDLRDVVRRFDGALAPRADPKFVEQVRLDPGFHTIPWPGELDLDPVVLYCVVKGIAVPGESRARTNRAHRASPAPRSRRPRR